MFFTLFRSVTLNAAGIALNPACWECLYGVLGPPIVCRGIEATDVHVASIGRLFNYMGAMLEQRARSLTARC